MRAYTVIGLSSIGVWSAGRRLLAHERELQMKQLYMEGHHVKRGYVVSLECVACEPVRFYKLHPRKVRAVVDRFNRMQRYLSIASR